jgi:pimeloyl-ACP methyl ester carboxylesterase
MKPGTSGSSPDRERGDTRNSLNEEPAETYASERHWPNAAAHIAPITPERRTAEHVDIGFTQEQADGPVLQARWLAPPGRPALEMIEVRPPSAGTAPPILFVHGAFAGAWCWSEFILPIFGRRGRHCAAVSLHGHGASEGGAELRSASLGDLVDDLAAAIDAMPEPPVVVAHSLGGYLAQILIGRARMRGLVLVGSLPPDGMALVGPRLAFSDTKVWSEAVAASIGNAKAAIDLAGLELLFGEGVPRERALRYAARMVPESPRALAEAHLPRPIVSAFMAGLPTFVVNGLADRLVWPATAFRTAIYHGAEHRLVAGGHFLMLDPGVDDVADIILRWLGDRGL